MKRHPLENQNSVEQLLQLQSLFDTAQSLYIKGQFEQAQAYYTEILQIDPYSFEAYYRLGNTLEELHQYEMALENYDKTLTLHPNHADAHAHRAVVLKILRKFDEALQSYDKAISLNPHYAILHSNRGNILQTLHRYEEALESYDRALLLHPSYVDAHSNRGITLYTLQRYEEALDCYNKAIALNPKHADAYANKGATLTKMHRYEDALENYNRAIALKPQLATAYSNRGNTLKALQRYHDALEDYNHAIAINPRFPGAYRNKALLLLLLGDLKKGFDLYEWRWYKDDFTSFARNFSQPLWLGKEDLKDKALLIHAEQGLGDTIHFSRYIERLTHLDSKIIFEIPEPLYQLFHQFKGVYHFVLKGDVLPHFDYHCPLMSLPLVFQTSLDNLPCSMPYLTANIHKRDYWKGKLKHLVKPKIGIVWSGSALHNNDHNRSIALQTLLGYLPNKVEYIVLQKELKEDDKSILQNHPNIHYFEDELNDFTDTAGLCDCMDLIISVDTSVAHLACAMNKETIILLPFVPDWRWMSDRSDSPWYPSAQLMRQTKINDWDSCLVQLKAFLDDKFH